MKLKNRRRFQLEQLEERCTPTISVVSGMLPDFAGNLNINLRTTGTALTINQTGVAQITLSDNAGGSLAINGVFGNISVTAATLAAGTFTTTLNLDGTTDGSILGNVNISLSRLSAAAPVNFVLDADTDSTIFGSLTVTTNVAEASTVTLQPTPGDVTIFGNMTINTTGGLLTHTKTVLYGSSGGALTTLGNFTANNLNVFTMAGSAANPPAIMGYANITTRSTTTVGQNAVSMDANSTIGNLTLTLGAATGAGVRNTADFNGTIIGLTSITVKSGALTTPNAITFGTTFLSFGSQIVISAGNGNNSLTFNGTAPLAKLTAVYGNGTNTVSFGATSALASATLVGGLGSNTVSGTITFPLSLFRFSF